MATEEEIREIKARINIAEVVAQYLKLKKSGKNFRGRCPFHQDNNPSFTISPEKNLFHCFGCGEGGDVFKFLMKIEGIDFPEAVRRLAEQSGVELTSTERNKGRWFRLKKINKVAAEYFHRKLFSKTGDRARKYLKKRGFTKDTVKAFKLGYAPPGWENLTSQVKKANSSKQSIGSEFARLLDLDIEPKLEDFLKLGLIVKSKDGGFYDRFRDRLIFPIFDATDNVIGFAGRSLSSGDRGKDRNGPKYLNVPNTPLFKKGAVLYGLNIARSRDLDQLILTEGYTDVMAVHQAGFQNVCAQMGTALTKKQVDIISRFFDQVILTYDRDVAGQEASLRGMSLLKNAGLEAKVTLLPKDSDPDDIINQRGKEGFEKFLKKAIPFHRFFLTHLEESHDLKSIKGKEEALTRACNFLDHIESVPLSNKIMDELAVLLNIPYEDVKMKMIKGSQVSFQPTKYDEERSSDDGWGAEDYLLYFLIKGDLTVDRIISEFKPKDFLKYERIMNTVFELYESNGQLDLDLLFEKLNPEQENMISRLSLSQRDFFENQNKAIKDNISKLRCSKISRHIEKLDECLKEAEDKGDEERTNRLFKDRARLQREMLRELRNSSKRWGTDGS